MPLKDYTNREVEVNNNVDPYEDEIKKLIQNKQYEEVFKLEKNHNYNLKKRENSILGQQASSSPNTNNNSINAYISQEGDIQRQNNTQDLNDANANTYVNSQITNKYLNDNLKAQGITQSGENAYLQAMQNNALQSEYNANYRSYLDREQEIEQNELDAQNEQLTTLIGSASTMDEVYSYLQNYGYLDANNQYTDKWNSLSDADKSYFTSLITNAENRLSSGNNEYNDIISNGRTSFNLDAIAQLGYTTAKGTTAGGTIGDKMQGEYNALVQNYGYLQNGDAIRMSNGGEDAGNAYFLYVDGVFYQLTENEYNNYKGRRFGISYNSGSGAESKAIFREE